MQLRKLIDALERAGYEMLGDRTMIDRLLDSTITLAPMVLVKRLPMTVENSTMIQDITAAMDKIQPGYVKVDGAVVVESTVIHLQFIPKANS